MNPIRVDTELLNARASELEKLQDELARLSETLGSISSSLTWQIPGSRNIKGSLNIRKAQVNLQRTRAGAMASGLRSISQLYAQTEKNITAGKTGGNAVSKSGGEGGGGGRSGPSWSNVNWGKWTDLWKLVEGAGLIGTLISTIGGPAMEKNTVKRVLGVLKGVAKTAEGFARATSKSRFDWFGLMKVPQGEVPKTLWESLGKQFDKYNVGNATNTSGKIAVFAKWAGTVLTVVSTGYDNIIVNKEGNSMGRAIAETVGESAVTIGLGIAVGAVVGTIGAPAVVAGAITVGALWAIDRGFEYFTGKGAAEFISDTVIDGIVEKGKAAIETGKAVVETGKKVVEGIGKAVSSGGKAIGGWWNKGLGRVFA